MDDDDAQEPVTSQITVIAGLEVVRDGQVVPPGADADDGAAQ
jgi:hypothetical protein